jgi:hypothetical protein
MIMGARDFKPQKYVWVLIAWELLMIGLLFTSSPQFEGLPRLAMKSSSKSIILLYHLLAMPFTAAVGILTIDAFGLKGISDKVVSLGLTAGALLASASALAYGYLGGGMIAHGVFLFGSSLIFTFGIPMVYGLLNDVSDIIRLNIAITGLLILGTAAIGGGVGAFFGTELEVVLAEDLLRSAGKGLLERGVVAHLHAMLALLDSALFFIAVKRFAFAGKLCKFVMSMALVGNLVMVLATWSVILVGGIAHKVINIGVTVLILSAVLFSVWVYVKRGLRDPVNLFVPTLMLWSIPTVLVPGVYVAINLETFRKVLPFEVERTFAVGHWHVLVGITVAIAFLLALDVLKVGGIWRVVSGYLVGTGTLISAAMANLYIFQPDGKTFLIPLELGLMMVVLGVLIGVIEPLIIGRLWNRHG